MTFTVYPTEWGSLLNHRVEINAVVFLMALNTLFPKSRIVIQGVNLGAGVRRLMDSPS